jgi:hypothetical protein
MLRNTIGRRLAGKNKHQQANTLGSARLISACSVNASTTQHGFVFLTESVRFGWARLGVQDQWALRVYTAGCVGVAVKVDLVWGCTSRFSLGLYKSIYFVAVKVDLLWGCTSRFTLWL